MSDSNTQFVGAILAILGEEAKAAFAQEAWRRRDTDIKYEGSQIVLPAEPLMPLEAAIEALQRKLKEENTFMDLRERIEGYPYDAAVAFLKAMKETYGWASPTPTPGFWGDTPPTLLTVATGPNPEDAIQVPMGSFKIPGVENLLTAHITTSGEHGTTHPTLCIHYKARKREQQVLKDLVAKAKAILARDSIYRGKAIRLTVKPDGSIDRQMQPNFIHTKHVRTEELIFSESVQNQLDVSLFTPIRHTAACIEIGVPLKRGVLLEGKYGVGKSMTATVASKVCVDHGWTFILVDKVAGLRDALEFAKAYQPALVFAEDIDRQVGERDDKANDLLNIISGVISANSKVITVLSTNHVERINQAMLRPGRLDAVISILPPDADAVGKLIRLYGRDLIGADEPLDRVGKELAGQIPATIREVCERAKLAMIHNKRQRIIEDDLMVSARGMVQHLALLNRPEHKLLTPSEQLGAAMSDVIGSAMGGGETVTKHILDVQEQVNRIVGITESMSGTVSDIDDRVSSHHGNGVDPGRLENIEKLVKASATRLIKIEKATVS